MSRPALALVAVLACLVAAPAASAHWGKQHRPDFAYNILPPGQYGGAGLNKNSTDQLPLYDGLTPLRGNVTEDDIKRLFKREDFTPTGATTPVPTPDRPGLEIVRDEFGVPHIKAKTREDLWYGAGLVTAQDRWLLLLLGRDPARAAVAEIPGVDAFSLVTNGPVFVPSPEAEALVTAQQQKLVDAYGDKGRQILADLKAYADGVTAGLPGSMAPWTVNDAIAVTAFIGSIFGNGGGAEVRNSEFLAKLRDQLGVRRGSAAFVDLMEADDRDAPTTTNRYFPYGQSGGSPTTGSPLVDPGSTQALSATESRLASNFLVVSPRRSATRESLAVMGPQLGYYYPEIVLEASLQGPGVKAQGALVPGGGPYVLIGRTQDYAWSLTSASNDNRDQFLEKLCEPDGSAATRDSRHYVYRGECRAMTTFNAGTLGGDPVSYPVTVHGPVSGTTLVDGKPYAIARLRSTYLEDGLGLAALRDMTLGRGRTVKGFFESANQFGFTFNWAYASRKATAYFSSGKLPRRAPRTNKLLPTLGNGSYDWRGFLSLYEHPHDVSGPGGLFLNWNNKPAPGWQTGDDGHTYGSVHRVDMFDDFPRRPRIADVVSIMNRAATEDLRATELWPVIRRVLNGSPPPDALTGRVADLITAWSRAGGSKLDGDLDGGIDDPAAAVIGPAWTNIANAALTPALGTLTNDLAGLQGRNSGMFGGGWYGYVDKDLRTLLGERVRDPYKLRYCGGGSLAACRDSLWAALKAAADQLAAAQGPDPTLWRADATAERLRFAPGLLPNTMRFANRPTFQQVLRFGR
ncbi:MAG TPA: penicillin acylase family protein [Thermoleophilaceae bacterium]|nr:penicillin acylase family protein [Thermoleophilaceae bacterium]